MAEYKGHGRELAKHSMKGIVTSYQLKESYWELRVRATETRMLIPEN